MLHRAVLHAGVAPQRLAAEPHDAIDLLPERLVADQSDGAPIGFGDIRQRGHIDLMQRCAARAARGRAQRQCQIVRGFQELRRVVLNAYGLVPGGMWKSRSNMRKAPGLAPRQA